MITWNTSGERVSKSGNDLSTSIMMYRAAWSQLHVARTTLTTPHNNPHHGDINNLNRISNTTNDDWTITCSMTYTPVALLS